MTDEVLGKDIGLQDSNDVKFSSSQDFSVIEYQNNLKQAILNRLRTVKGEYAASAEYGSELHKCFGQPRNDLLKNRIIGYIVEAMKQEPRVSSITTLEVSFDETNKDKVNVSMSVIPIGSQVALNLIFPLFI